jgi:ketosteroid isomerase-like protein
MMLSADMRFAIQDLFAAYGWALDTGDMDTLIGCFTPDAVMIEEVFEEPDIWEGHEGIRALTRHYFTSPGFPGRQHHVTQQQLSPQSDGSVQVRSFAFVTECHGEPPYTLRFAGWYEDLVVPGADGRWQFRHRTVRLWDGKVLERFPGHGEWVPRKRPPELMKNRG